LKSNFCCITNISFLYQSSLVKANATELLGLALIFLQEISFDLRLHLENFLTELLHLLVLLFLSLFNEVLQMSIPVAREHVLLANCISETIFEFALHEHNERVKAIFGFHVFRAGESTEKSIGHYAFAAELEGVTPVDIPEDAGVPDPVAKLALQPTILCVEVHAFHHQFELYKRYLHLSIPPRFFPGNECLHSLDPILHQCRHLQHQLR